MKPKASRAIVTRIVRSRFPTVVVRDREVFGTPGRAYFDVFYVPDDRLRESICFMLDELPGILDRRGVGPATCMTYGSSWTREHHPEIRPLRARRRAKPRRRVAAAR